MAPIGNAPRRLLGTALGRSDGVEDVTLVGAARPLFC